MHIDFIKLFSLMNAHASVIFSTILTHFFIISISSNINRMTKCHWKVISFKLCINLRNTCCIIIDATPFQLIYTICLSTGLLYIVGRNYDSTIKQLTLTASLLRYTHYVSRIILLTSPVMQTRT